MNNVTIIANNSLKSAIFLRPGICFNLLALARKAKPTALISVVTELKWWNSFRWCTRIPMKPPFDAHGGSPIMLASCEKMISSELAVMKPLKAGLDKKRTRKASLQTPITTKMTPTSRVKIAPAWDRYSMSSPSLISCSPVSKDTRAPVPTEAWMLVPNTAYMIGGMMQLYGPLMSRTLHRSACASDCPIKMQPRVKPPEMSAKKQRFHG
mmetsp:Transcript_107685/g.310008  ORF Transcript_107685/g.310008 Transcript_107685/m.310008 type:complete len:210 (-) Transcript_107685:143-772(-)